MEQKFYICEHCGNIITKIDDKGVPVMCCGEKMKELVPGTSDASLEKHVPVWAEENGTVRVRIGEAEHPMVPEHYIQWVYLQTNMGGQLRYLKPGEKPEAVFALAAGEKPEAVFAYCNLHSLWKK